MKQVRKRQITVLLAAVLFGIVLYFLNRIDRTPLYDDQGRSFEKAVVLEVVQDNVQESGQYVGQQTVRLVLKSGDRKGHTVEAKSSSSYLYGAHCVPGMKVIAAEKRAVTIYM